MVKKFYILVFILFATFSYGQNITFQSNVNHDARNLKQSLNETGDSLILESKKTIRQVDILNEDFFKSINIDSTKTAIDLNILPIGNFIITARIGRKRIVMYLEKSKLEILKESNLDSSVNKDEYIDRSDSSPKQKPNTILENEKTLFWVVSESNSNFGSSKTMRLEYKSYIDKLISKIKLELKTDIGKHNKLFVYEIYDRSKFMTKQLRNSVYYKSETSEFFNVVPIYNSLHN
ncbi:hypothetical protein [Psychroserpens sp.]